EPIRRTALRSAVAKRRNQFETRLQAAVDLHRSKARTDRSFALAPGGYRGHRGAEERFQSFDDAHIQADGREAAGVGLQIWCKVVKPGEGVEVLGSYAAAGDMGGFQHSARDRLRRDSAD